jgi:hypothetical protein
MRVAVKGVELLAIDPTLALGKRFRQQLCRKRPHEQIFDPRVIGDRFQIASILAPRPLAENLAARQKVGLRCTHSGLGTPQQLHAAIEARGGILCPAERGMADGFTPGLILFGHDQFDAESVRLIIGWSTARAKRGEEQAYGFDALLLHEPRSQQAFEAAGK